MFFRREKITVATFQSRIDDLKKAGFAATNLPSGGVRVSKGGCAAVLQDSGTEHPKVSRAGIVVGDEIGEMLHGGYQMFFVTESGRKVPALAEHLKAIHAFEEDLREGLGLISLYNVSLGTRADQHMYDRVKGRDFARSQPAWEKPAAVKPVK